MPSSSPAAVTTPHLPVRQDWLDRRQEEIIEPELPIVDPHHHLVDDQQLGLDDLLTAPVEPILPDRQMRAGDCSG